MFQRRVVGLILAAFAAGLMVFTLLSHRWWSMKEGDESVYFGLRSVEMCDEDGNGSRKREHCETRSLGKLFKEEEDRDRRYDDYDSSYDEYEEEPAAKEPSAFLLMGNLTFFGGIAAGALLVICGGAVLMNAHARASRGLGNATAIGSAVFGAAGLIFVVLAPDQMKEVPLGLALPLALVGAGCGVAAGIVLGKYDPAVEPRPMPTAVVLSGLAPSKVPSMVLAVLGAVLVLFAIFTNTWWSRSEDDFTHTIGVREEEGCFKDYNYDYDDYGAYDSDRPRRGKEKCETQTLKISDRDRDYDSDDGGSSEKTFIRAGRAVYHTGLAACVLCLLAGTLMLANQKLPGPLTPANLLVGVAGLFLLASLVFLASKPSSMKEMSASFGPVLALGGGGCLIGAGIAIGRFVSPGMTAGPQAWGPPGMAPMGPLPSGPMMPMPMPGPHVGYPGYPGQAPPMGSPYAPPLPPLAPPPPPAPPQVSPVTPLPGSIPAMVTDQRSGPVTPACPQCAAPMVFTPQHGRWFCATCRIYA